MRPSEASQAIRRKQEAILTRGMASIGVILFSVSGVINLLALTGSFYMLEIYDRALPSGNVPTLVAMSVLAIGLYLFQGLFEVLRAQILVRVGARFDKQIAPLAHRVAIDMPRFGFSTAEALERGRDVDTLRTFVSGQGPVALFDLPWMPLFLAFVYLLHPLLGALTLGGMLVLTLLTVVTELLTRRKASATHSASIRRASIAESNARNAEVFKAMGFSSRAVSRFNEANAEHIALHTRSNDLIGSLASLSRILRMVLQSAVLGLGAYLVINGQLSAGSIIAGSVASARALAPIDLAIGNWKNFVAARAAYGRIKETVVALGSMQDPMPLPKPSHGLKVEGLTVAAPSTGRVLLTDVTFSVNAGDAVGIIGPSGGGKTTLVRALTGIWPTLRGSIRIDGAELSQWDDDTRGAFMGYMPQDVALIDAAVDSNIARLDPNPDPKLVYGAAQAAGVHEMILRLSEGYKTELGPSGTAISAGQRQRIGLARALYGDPFIVVLDEPNSNLDAEGEAALNAAIKAIKARGGIAIVIAHRPSVLEAVDYVGVVQDGKLVAYGPKPDIIPASRSVPAAAIAETTNTVNADMKAPRRAVANKAPDEVATGEIDPAQQAAAGGKAVLPILAMRAQQTRSPEK